MAQDPSDTQYSEYDDTWEKYSDSGELKTEKLFGRVFSGWLYAAGSGILAVLSAFVMIWQDGIEWIGTLAGGFIETAMPTYIIDLAWSEAYFAAKQLGPFAPVVLALVLIATAWILTRLEERGSK